MGQVRSSSRQRRNSAITSGATSGPVEQLGLSSVQFSQLARELARALESEGAAVPSFRCPPRSPHLDRSLARHHDGSITISVRLRRRPATAVVADMIDGAVHAQGLTGKEAGALRDLLWARAEAALAAWSVQAAAA